MQSTSTDFTSIENLIAKADNQVQQKQTGYYGTQNGHRQKIPLYYIVPVLCHSLEDYYQKLGHIQLNTPCTALSKPTDSPQSQSVSEQEPAPQLKSKKVQRKIKQKRRPFTFEQIAILSERFEKLNSIDTEEKKELAKKLGLTPAQVGVWFQNRRTDEARHQTIKRRIPYSADQLAILEDKFSKSKYIDNPGKVELAKNTKLSEKQIQDWFQYRRRQVVKDARRKEQVDEGLERLKAF